MLPRVAEHIWTATRWMQTALQDMSQSSMLLGVWQAPGVLCTMHTCWRPHARTRKQLKALYSVEAAVRILATESQVEWIPSRDWFYDQINEARSPFFLDAKKRKRLDGEGLAAARKLAKETHTLQQQRKAIMDYQTQQMGKTKAAAKKWRQRHAKLGDCVEDMAKALLSQGNGTLYPKQQRGSNP